MASARPRRKSGKLSISAPVEILSHRQPLADQLLAGIALTRNLGGPISQPQAAARLVSRALKIIQTWGDDNWHDSPDMRGIVDNLTEAYDTLFSISADAEMNYTMSEKDMNGNPIAAIPSHF